MRSRNCIHHSHTPKNKGHATKMDQKWQKQHGAKHSKKERTKNNIDLAQKKNNKKTKINTEKNTTPMRDIDHPQKNEIPRQNSI